jgi:hypothetical protein
VIPDVPARSGSSRTLPTGGNSVGSGLTRGRNLPFAGTRDYDVTPGTFTVNLVCYASNTFGFAAGPQSAQLTALFVPS